ncbi:lipopolysaccharide assembly protein LapA domain-containing protein [Marinomonas atlantica]|uniref:lipopolysaccharide assembly protein LapA domain-containing protein n=1 Tax=Marinomonas atlantica TaxID=1806668 RepID=UPI00082C8896|nr:LapA family protein [Marinomonas atlantica]MCO4786867.1 LapA family protein [Marinomonas atlantica]
MLKWLKRVILLVVLAFFLFIGLFFAIRNGQVITLDLVLWQSPELSVALYMIIAFAVGVILALASSSMLLFRLERRSRKQNKQLVNLQTEIDNLRKASLSTELAERE